MMALERVPADIRKQGGVARMSDPKVELLEKLCTIFFSAWFITQSSLCLVDDQRDHGCRHNPSDGKGSHWTLC